MAVTEASSTHKDSVDPLLEGAEYVMRRHTGGTHHPDDPNIGRILNTTDPSQVSSGVCSPRAEEAQHLRFEPVVAHANSLLG